MELNVFLVKAKTHTYASGNPPKKMEDGFEEFVYEEGDYTYRDRYHAKDPKPFGGEEVVFYKGKPIWIMHYYGYLVANQVDSKKVYEFLRKAMSLVNEKRPFRGPPQFIEGDFEYTDENGGDINNFNGIEIISFNGKEVYRLEYHGGAL